jgi:hypothetical protein
LKKFWTSHWRMIFSEVQMPLGDLESVNLISLPSYNSFSMKKSYFCPVHCSLDFWYYCSTKRIQVVEMIKLVIKEINVALFRLCLFFSGEIRFFISMFRLIKDFLFESKINQGYNSIVLLLYLEYMGQNPTPMIIPAHLILCLD